MEDQLILTIHSIPKNQFQEAVLFFLKKYNFEACWAEDINNDNSPFLIFANYNGERMDSNEFVTGSPTKNDWLELQARFDNGENNRHEIYWYPLKNSENIPTSEFKALLTVEGPTKRIIIIGKWTKDGWVNSYNELLCNKVLAWAYYPEPYLGN